MKLMISGLMVVTLLAIPAAVRAGSGDFGFLNNDGTKLTHTTFAGQRETPLDGVPELVNEPGYTNPRGFGSFYYGDGQTHEGVPIAPWSGMATDVGLTITGIQHDGTAVSSGFLIGSGELGGFNDIFALGIHPQNLKGLNETLTIVTAQQITDGVGAGTGAHAHVYLDAGAPGVWDISFVLTDLASPSTYQDSQAFSMRFIAVPEPATMLLFLLGGCVTGLTRSRGVRSMVVGQPA